MRACVRNLMLDRLYVLNRHLENIQLRVLENSSVPFDVAFFVMQRQKEIKAADKAARPGGCVSSRSWCRHRLVSKGVAT